MHFVWIVQPNSHPEQVLPLQPNRQPPPLKKLISVTPANCEGRLNQQYQEIYHYGHSKGRQLNVNSPHFWRMMTAHLLHRKTYLIVPHPTEDNLPGIRLIYYSRPAKLILTSLDVQFQT